MLDIYKSQVALLLRIIPFIADEKIFALKGGTAINLFIRELPRLSVDIDLTYLPFNKRDIALKHITGAFKAIELQIENKLPDVKVRTVAQEDGNDTKLICRSSTGAQIKVEVNTVMRGCLFEPRVLPCVNKVVDEFESFAEISVVSDADLYGGKICAALDRQHPRDMFDIKYLFADGALNDDIKRGFLLCLLSSDRPIHEVIHPTLTDQRQTLEKHFKGMTDKPFAYEEFEAVRENLIAWVSGCFTAQEKAFLLSFKAGEPDWKQYGFEDFEKFPALQWKLLNINKLKTHNPKKHQIQYEALKKRLD